MRDQFQPSVECADFHPLYDFCLVRRLPDETAWRGLHVPDNAKDHERGIRRGVVEKVGPGDKRPLSDEEQGAMRYDSQDETIALIEHGRHPMNVKPGDIVLYDRVPANDVRLNGVEYTLAHEEQHILAVLDHEPITFDLLYGFEPVRPESGGESA